MAKTNKITLDIPEDDVEEVIHLIRYALCEQPSSNSVWTLLSTFCEEHSSIKFKNNWEELSMYSVNCDNRLNY